MQTTKLRSDLILVLAAVIWGFAFVAQRIGMDYVGPFTYNGVRFLLGTLVLLPLLYIRIRKGNPLILQDRRSGVRKITAGAIFTGLLLFSGVAFQQLGLQKTTAGKAGFITGLYVAFVPVVGLFFSQKSRWYIWAGVLLSVTGLYFLSITQGFNLAPGDSLVIMCAFIFTFHVLFIGWLSPLMDSILLAVIQFSITTVINFAVAFTIETISLLKILEAWAPICYGGILSVGVAYTLQIIVQKTTHPAYVSIILGLEAVFAAIGGILILHESMTLRMLAGCLLMLAGTILVQQQGKKHTQ
jgi:drug/metabolite transporter (DMT)-like permease